MENAAITFPTRLAEIKARIEIVNPETYATTRNYVDGAVSYLSPYISRGVLSTRELYEYIVSLERPWHKIEKFVQELAWRDYWQHVWVAKGEGIQTDLKTKQLKVKHHQIPEAIIHAQTGIDVVDKAIKTLYKTGYMHNHMRMYVASICCNVAQCHWLQPAKWLYSHLLDGDLASNHLSWQWVVGTNSKKKYYANQDNINTFFRSTQRDTFLDVTYSAFDQLEVPEVLVPVTSFDLKVSLPKMDPPHLIRGKKTLVYNYYNLDPNWYASENVQRVLLLEPAFFEKKPVHPRCIDFALQLAMNIKGMQIFIGSFSELSAKVEEQHLVYKEHPENQHYVGNEEPRQWLSSITGYHPSFFAFWKRCKKELQQ